MSEELTELPKSWEKTTLGEATFLIRGITFPSSAKLTQPTEDSVLCLRTSNIQEVIEFDDILIIPREFLKRNDQWVQVGDTIISMANSYELVGKVALATKVPPKTTIGGFLSIIRSKLLDPDYLFYLLRSSRMQEMMRRTASRTVNIANISLRGLEPIEIPLPPLNEQRRIVAKIEALRARSQRTKEALEAIPPLLDQFRQSVLAAAFRGDLTAGWRKQNSATKWERTTLGEIIKGKPRNGYSPKPVDYPTKVKSLTLSATTSGKFKPEYFKYIDEEIDSKSHLWLYPGDVLIQRSNTLDYVGTCAIYNGAFGEFIYPDLMMKIQVIENKAKTEFIYYALSSESSRKYFKENATGTAGNMPKINQQVVMNTPISIPSLEEQKEIVRRVQQLLKAADFIQQQYQEARAYLDKLDQSILAKAFQGELVPQDPDDEPASVLIERIRAERAKKEAEAKDAKTKGKTRGRRKIDQVDLSGQINLPGLE